MSERGAKAESASWVRAHADVLQVAHERAGLEGRQGACLLRAFREDVHRHLGYGDFPEYSDRQLGYGHRTTQEKLRTAEALERLPELARALQVGKLHASAVRGLTRVATRETETDWIAAAAGRRMREIERLVAGRAQGDRPSDTPPSRGGPSQVPNQAHRLRAVRAGFSARRRRLNCGRALRG